MNKLYISTGLIIAMVVLLCLSLIGIPLAIMIAVWFLKKTDKGKCCVHRQLVQERIICHQ